MKRDLRIVRVSLKEDLAAFFQGPEKKTKANIQREDDIDLLLNIARRFAKSGQLAGFLRQSCHAFEKAMDEARRKGRRR